MNSPAIDEPLTAPESKRSGRRVLLFVLLGAVLLGGLGYVAAYLVAGEKVPRGTTVAGVDVGGRERDAAIETLEKGLAPRLATPLTVTVEGTSQRLAPKAAGLAVDYEASIERAGGGRSWAPGDLWNYFTGGDRLDPVVTADDTALTATIRKIEAKAGRKVRDGRWQFRGGRPKAIAPVVGRSLDPSATQDALAAAYSKGLAGGDARATLELVDVQPEIDATDMQQARTRFVDPAMSGPVTLAFGESTVTWQPRQYAHTLRLTPKDGRLVPGVDLEQLEALLGEHIGDNGKPVDATVRLVDGTPQVVPGKPGITYDAAQLRTRFLGMVTGTGKARTATIAAKADEPDFTTAHAKALKIVEEVSEFTTRWPHAEYRNVNIGRAAELINGTVLKPGETFSLNGIVGERTAANGFTKGYIILDGILVQDFGGGVSQIATTTFNAMFFAGLEDVQHKPHSFFIDRYPEGREATVAWPSLDMSFRNNTPYGVLVQAFIDPSNPYEYGSVTVRMYSTKHWDIKARKSDRYAFVPPATRTLTTPDCEEHTGSSGFQVDVWRDFRKPGSSQVVRTEKFHTTYKPADTVVCKEPPREPAAG